MSGNPERPGRRAVVLAGAAALGAGALGAGALGGLPGTGLARAPPLGTQAPAYFRFMIGDFEATVVSDGPLPLGDPHRTFLGLSRAEIDRQLSDNFLPNADAVLEQNALVVNTGDRLVLFDTGMGTLRTYGPATGRLLARMAQAGIDPRAIDAVVIGHAHIDHCGGCMADDGARRFPNAQYYIAQADYAFWTDATKVPDGMRIFLDTARRNLVPNRDRMVFFEDGQEFLPGIQAIAAPGHTVGHTIFMISSAGRSMSYVGDLAHHPVLLLEQPLTEFAYDTDPKLSARTRVKMLAMLAANRIPLLAYHFPWPGLGHVARRGEGFRYHPEAMRMTW